MAKKNSLIEIMYIQYIKHIYTVNSILNIFIQLTVYATVTVTAFSSLHSRSVLGKEFQ